MRSKSVTLPLNAHRIDKKFRCNDLRFSIVRYKKRPLTKSKRSLLFLIPTANYSCCLLNLRNSLWYMKRKYTILIEWISKDHYSWMIKIWYRNHDVLHLYHILQSNNLIWLRLSDKSALSDSLDIWGYSYDADLITNRIVRKNVVAKHIIVPKSVLQIQYIVRKNVIQFA